MSRRPALAIAAVTVMTGLGVSAVPATAAPAASTSHRPCGAAQAELLAACYTAVGVGNGLAVPLLTGNAKGNSGTWRVAFGANDENDNGAKTMTAKLNGKRSYAPEGSYNNKDKNSTFGPVISYAYDQHGRSYKYVTIQAEASIVLSTPSEPFVDVSTDIITASCKRKASVADPYRDCTTGTERTVSHDYNHTDSLSYKSGTFTFVEPVAYAAYSGTLRNGQFHRKQTTKKATGTVHYTGKLSGTTMKGRTSWSIKGVGSHSIPVKTAATSKVMYITT